LVFRKTDKIFYLKDALPLAQQTLDGLDFPFDILVSNRILLSSYRTVLYISQRFLGWSALHVWLS